MTCSEVKGGALQRGRGRERSPCDGARTRVTLFTVILSVRVSEDTVNVMRVSLAREE